MRIRLITKGIVAAMTPMPWVAGSLGTRSAAVDLSYGGGFTLDGAERKVLADLR